MKPACLKILDVGHAIDVVIRVLVAPGNGLS